MAEAARRDQNPSSAPPALSVRVASRRGGRREKNSGLSEGDNFIAGVQPTAPSGAATRIRR
jgi:hypothetical protein